MRMSLLASSRTNRSELLAYFPFSSNLIDQLSGASATLTRSSTKQVFSSDRQTLSVLAINEPAYRGGGILVDPADTNYIPYSSSLGSWTTEAGSTGAIVLNAVNSPTGVLEADTLSYVYNKYRASISVGGSKFFYGCFVRRTDDEEGAYFRINRANSLLNFKIEFATNTASIVSRGASWASNTEVGCEAMGDNWWHVWCWTSCSNAGSANFHVANMAPNNDAGDVVAFWGMYKQTRLSCPIPTGGSSVTRTADSLVIASSVVPFVTNRTLYMHFIAGHKETGILFSNGTFEVARNYSTGGITLTIYGNSTEVLTITGNTSWDHFVGFGIAICVRTTGIVEFWYKGYLSTVQQVSTVIVNGSNWGNLVFGSGHTCVVSEVKHIAGVKTIDEAIAL